ncbi:hypothetical protein BGX28_009322, partial [Mortierella sp. GBA30]
MGQVNSTQASTSQRAPDPSPPSMMPPPPPSSSASSSIPSVEDMRNLTSRILASTSDKLKSLRENMPAIELPSSLSTSSSSSSSSSSSTATAAAATDDVGFATDSGSVVVMTTSDHQLLVYRPFDKDKASVADLIKIHYQLSVGWIKDNARTVVMGVTALGIAM